MSDITPKSQQIIDALIVRMDADPRIPHAYSEAEVIELALRLLEICNVSDPNMPIMWALRMAIITQKSKD